jgi:hypothetical protein
MAHHSGDEWVKECDGGPNADGSGVCGQVGIAPSANTAGGFNLSINIHVGGGWTNPDGGGMGSSGVAR